MNSIIIIVLILFNTICLGQTSPKSILDTLIIKAKETSLYSANVNWDSLQKQVYQKAEGAKTIDDLKPAFETLLNGLRDYHGKIVNAENYSIIASFTDYENLRHPDTRPRNPEIWKVVNNKNATFECKILQGNIGYLKIVGIAPNANVEIEAKKIRNAINKCSKFKITNFILDLRYNSGGNMLPMMAGIGPLLGDGVVGSLVGINNVKQFNWEVKNGNFIYGGYQAVDLPNKTTFTKHPNVAVLTSRWTVSSGELVATAFKGRADTRFFGEATGSFASNTNWERINDKVIASISTGIYCDRNDIVYRLNIPVDVEVPFIVTNETENDECIIVAKKWLSEK